VLPIARAGGCRAAYSTPLLNARGEILGTIAVYFSEPHRPSERETRLVELYAAQAARAIENARLYSEAEAGRATLEALMEHVPEGIVVADAPGVRPRAVSRFARELAGAGEEENPIVRLRRPDGSAPPAEELPISRAIGSGAVTQGEEWVIERPDGARRLLLVSAGPILDNTGNVTGGIAAWRDITERKQLEERMREVQRAESVGRLAAGVAHDFNNLLTRVLGGASLAIDLLDSQHPAAGLLADVMSAAERGSELTTQLLAYTGKGRFVVRDVSLSEVVRQVGDLLRGSVPIHIRLTLDLAADLPPARVDANQVQQVLVSLIANAAEAIGDLPGAIAITTGVETVRTDAWLTGWSGEAPVPGNYVFLEVADTGCGMDEETAARIFEPFFTTRFMGRGLGLSAAQGIVKGHQGGFRVRSKPGEGSTFRVLFPAAQAQPAAPPVRTVLVVDDEQMVARVAQLTLERAGYRVVVAESGAEALEALERREVEIGLVLLDLKMPGMSGQETLARIRGLRPGLKVVLLTAYDGAEAVRLVADRESVCGFIQKPYTPAELLEQLRPLLE
jgi:PAS domain S-box-containing protein